MDDRTALAADKLADRERAERAAAALHRRFPTIAHLRKHARRHVPHFVYEFMDGGAGADVGIAHNWAALDAVELVPRYGVMPALPPIDVELFGRRYAAPIGIAPMGGPALVWPGADAAMARAAQQARVPYTLGTVGGIAIEEAAALAPDVFWFQLYRVAQNDHALGLDLVRRADAAGAHVLVLTIDVPVRTTRSREAAVGLGRGPFRPDLPMMLGMLRSPAWLMALMRNGRPQFANIRAYAPANASGDEVIRFTRQVMGGAFTWDEIARFRDRWRRPMVLKGVLHPLDAAKAVAMGIEGIWVSNHGGRQIEALPPAIDVLPAIAAEVGGRATLIMDSGIRSGVDVIRAVALGAQAAFAGKAFLWGLGALGEAGPEHVINLLMAEARSALGQIGAHSPAEARSVAIRHPGAFAFRKDEPG
jgi:(S)-mandelate dehydrogenase